jgi:hypothetical protein
MRMDDENRKKLERLWRRKLWLGLSAVGAIGLSKASLLMDLRADDKCHIYSYNENRKIKGSRLYLGNLRNFLGDCF